MIAMALQFFGCCRIFHRLADRLRRQHVCRRRCAACWHRAAPPRRSRSASSTASCPARWSMPSSPRRRAPAGACRLLVMVAFGLGTFPGDADDGRRRPAARPGLAAARRQARRRASSWRSASSPSAAACCPRTCIPAMPGWAGSRTMTARDAVLCSHCLLPIGLRADGTQDRRRGARLLLLRLLPRLPGQARAKARSRRRPGC